MRVLIVDDERPARDKLRRLLAQETDIAALEEAADGVAALECIVRCAPDLIFLDIQMPEISGLEVAASLPELAAHTMLVFVTAYDQYAIAAFDANAIDYLLKPFDQARLQRALQRVRERRRVSLQASAVPELSGNPPAAQSYASAGPISKLLVSERGVIQVVPVADIQWLETADNYVVLHIAGSQPLLRQTLSALLENLGPGFVRCHRRAAVQLAWVERAVAQGKGDYELELKGGARVPCSRQFSANLLEKLATV